MLRIQQGLYLNQKRAIIVFEGFDASGKGGAIRRLTQALDPRGAIVHPIGPPAPDEQGKHWLYRFWTKLPSPGTLAVFDRSWYGRVLVERVDNLTPTAAWKRAYTEINEFERMLTDDGIDVVKIFLAISKREQLKRFKDRLRDPYKQWKLKDADLDARRKWDDYVRATDELLAKTNARNSPWHLIPADDKTSARIAVLKIVTGRLIRHRRWMEKQAQNNLEKSAQRSLRKLQKL